MRNLIIALALAAAGCATTTTERRGLPPVVTVEHVDLQRYLGTWYEIAAYPQRFQRGCTATTATYSLRDDGDLEVVNRCRDGSPQGPERVARGRARVVDRSTGAKLEVSFFWPFWGDYWIIDLDADYQWAVVGHPGRDYLWILARTPALSDETWSELVERVTAQGFEPDRMQVTRHR